MSTKAWKTSTLVNFMAGYLYDMTLSNGNGAGGGDATNDITIAAGKCVDSTGVRVLSGSAMTKQLDASWAAGNNAGGRMSAAAIANTTYHVFAILKDSDGSVDYGFDTSPTAPTMPSGYTYFRRIGSILREGGVIVGFSQRGDEFLRTTPSLDASAQNPGDSAVTRTLSLPTGVKVDARLVVHLLDLTASAEGDAYISSLDQTDIAADAPAILTIPNAGGIAQRACTTGVWRTNTSAQIRTRLKGSTTDHYLIIATHGWVDTRGRLAP